MIASPIVSRASLCLPSTLAPRPVVRTRSSFQTRATSTDRDSTEVDITESTEKVIADIKKKWDDVEEKPAAIGIALSAVIALYALNGVVNAVDTIPVVSSALELVGLFVTAWFVYRYLIFGPDREELKENIDAFWVKVSGKKLKL